MVYNEYFIPPKIYNTPIGFCTPFYALTRTILVPGGGVLHMEDRDFGVYEVV